MSTDEPTCGIYEVADILGVSPQRADQLSRQVGFPDHTTGQPGQGLRKRRKWLRADVEAYAAARKPTTSTEEGT